MDLLLRYYSFPNRTNETTLKNIITVDMHTNNAGTYPCVACVCFQHKLHEDFGGVVPGLAMQAHRDRIDAVVAEALSQAGLAGPE